MSASRAKPLAPSQLRCGSGSRRAADRTGATCAEPEPPGTRSVRSGPRPILCGPDIPAWPSGKSRKRCTLLLCERRCTYPNGITGRIDPSRRFCRDSCARWAGSRPAQRIGIRWRQPERGPQKKGEARASPGQHHRRSNATDPGGPDAPAQSAGLVENAGRCRYSATNASPRARLNPASRLRCSTG